MSAISSTYAAKGLLFLTWLVELTEFSDAI